MNELSGRSPTRICEMLLSSTQAFIAGDDAFANAGAARADQHRQDPSRGGAYAVPPDGDDGTAVEVAGARDLRPGDRASGRVRRRAGHRRGEANPAPAPLLDLHRRGA